MDFGKEMSFMFNKKNLKIGWTIYSEKSQGKKYKSWRSDVFANDSISKFETKNYKEE